MSDRRPWHIKDPATQARILDSLRRASVGRSKHRGRLMVHEHAHPLVRRFFNLLNRHMTTMQEVAQRTSINPCTISGWRFKANPSLANFEAALNAIGYRLQIVEIDSVTAAQRTMANYHDRA